MDDWVGMEVVAVRSKAGNHRHKVVGDHSLDCMRVGMVFEIHGVQNHQDDVVGSRDSIFHYIYAIACVLDQHNTIDNCNLQNTHIDDPDDNSNPKFRDHLLQGRSTRNQHLCFHDKGNHDDKANHLPSRLSKCPKQ